VISTALVVKQRCGKHISAAVNQHATIQKAVFSMGVAPRLYNEDLRDKPIFSSERKAHKDYYRRSSAEKKNLVVGLKGLDAKTN
jgi:hypothetical protein